MQWYNNTEDLLREREDTIRVLRQKVASLAARNAVLEDFLDKLRKTVESL